MKTKLLSCLLLLMMAITANAQIVKGDMNDDKTVDITDVVSSVNVVLGNQPMEEINVLEFLKSQEFIFTTSDGKTVVMNGSQLTSTALYREYVDLDLPSGTLWATTNVGASKPEEAGDYYAYGEIETKNDYTLNTYQYYKNRAYVNIGTDISGTEYDVAKAKWGEMWCIPTQAQVDELCENCTYEWTTLNGVTGAKFTGKNGNIIFIPAAGWRRGTVLSGQNTFAYTISSTSYYSSTTPYYYSLSCSVNKAFSESGVVYDGVPVRPVRSKGKDPHEYVDLGLPSGTKWACCNVGADKPEDYGGHYAWDETEEKDYYDESTYKYYQNNSYVSLGSDISGTEYDVAHVKWGGNWVMPTLDDINELLDNCRIVWTTLNGVNGQRFTSNINNNSIFLPAAGYRLGGDLYIAGSYGDYWSSTQRPGGSSSACDLYFGSGGAGWYYYSRYRGYSVRPVLRK